MSQKGRWSEGGVPIGTVRLLVKGAVGDHSGRWSHWHEWGWTSLRLGQGKAAEVGDAGFPEAAVAGHNLGGVHRSL